MSATFTSRYSGNASVSTLRFFGENNLVAAFGVTETIGGELSGQVDLTGAGGVGVKIDLSPGDITLEYGEDDLNSGPIEINRAVTFEPGTLYVLAINVRAGQDIFDGSADGSAFLDFSLKVGDEDEDGLPDIWEENNGISTEGDAELEINFQDFDIMLSPRRKDLIVEVDMQSGSTFPLQILSEVVEVFKDSPVPNPDGSRGIDLHLIVDDRNLPSRAYSNAGLRAEIADQKDKFYGTNSQRSHRAWDSIKRFKLRSMRYAVIGGAREDGGSGWGEIPGDDFIVTTDGFLGLRGIDFAGVFMHELGHTLGLEHGGSDSLNFKPNYLSVMNYLFMVKSNLGDKIPWTLDYSGSQLATLNEYALWEKGGFGDKDASGASTQTLINVAATGKPLDIRRVPVLARKPVDFNGNGSIDSDPDSVDLNHFPVPGATPGQRLRGYDDWSNLTLALVGSVNFGDGVGEGGASAEEFDPQDYEALRQLYESVPGVVARESGPGIPNVDRLSVSAWPNPARSHVEVRYYVPSSGFVDVFAYDILGRRVATIADTYRTPGRYTVKWELLSSQTQAALASGVYLVRIAMETPQGPQHDVLPLIVTR